LFTPAIGNDATRTQ